MNGFSTSSLVNTKRGAHLIAILNFNTRLLKVAAASLTFLLTAMPTVCHARRRVPNTRARRRVLNTRARRRVPNSRARS